jgi:hypothetical protein
VLAPAGPEHQDAGRPRASLSSGLRSCQ